MPLDRFRRAASWDDFPDHLRALATAPGEAPWALADTPELAGLERYGAMMCEVNRTAAVRALVAAARAVFPDVLVDGADQIVDFGITRDAAVVDGAPVETQLEAVAAYADGTGDRGAVVEAFDPTRERFLWDEGRRPAPDAAWKWFYEVGQCACAAALDEADAGADGDNYYAWSACHCVGRGLVLVARSRLAPGTDLDEVLRTIGAAIAAALA